jgi:hypothetical protein
MKPWTKPTIEPLPAPTGKNNPDTYEAGYGMGRGPS